MWAILFSIAMLGQNVTADFSSIDEQIQHLEQDRLAVQLRQHQLQQEINKSEKTIKEAQHQRIALYQKLRQRLLAYKSLQPTLKTAILTKSPAIGEALRQAQLLRLITDQDRQLLDDLAINQSRLAILQEELSQKHQQTKQLNEKLLAQLDKLATLRADTLKVILSEAETQNSIQNLRFDEQKGLLPWPVSLSQNGNNQAKIVPANHGLNITTGIGAVVSAIADGQVIYSGAVPGYGQLVIIDHGHNYYSIYGQLSRTIVNKDDKITTSQMLGMVAPPLTAEEQPILYFELRHRGITIDPLPWLMSPL